MSNILLAMDRTDIYRKENRVSLKNTHVYIKSIDFMFRKLGYPLIFRNTSLSDSDVVKKYYANNTIESIKAHEGSIILKPSQGVASFSYLCSHKDMLFILCNSSYAAV